MMRIRRRLLLIVVVSCWITAAARGQVRDASISGQWNSNLGAVALRQSGTQVQGTLRFQNGAVASIAGTVQGGTFTFRWFIAQNSRGGGTLTLDQTGNRLSGSYDDAIQQTSGQFILARQQPTTRPAPAPQSFVEDLLRLVLPPNPGDGGGRETVIPRTEDEQRRLPAAENLTRLSADQLQRFAQRSLEELDRELNALKAGSRWKEHLQLEDLKRITAAQNPGPLSVDARQQLSEIQDRFDQARNEPGFETVEPLLGFQAVRSTFAALRVTPTQYYQQRTAAEFEAFAGSLKQLPPDLGWTEYFQVDALPTLLQRPVTEFDGGDRKQIKQVYQRFENIHGDPRYHVVNDRTRFQDAARSLTEFAVFLPPLPAAETIFHVALPSGALLYYRQKDLRSYDRIYVDPDAGDKRRTFHWDVARVRHAGGVIWQISSKKFPDFDNGSEEDLKPDGLVTSGFANGATGSFDIDFDEMRLSPAGLSAAAFRLRVLPVVSAEQRQLVGQPSHELLAHLDRAAVPKIRDKQLIEQAPPKRIEVPISFELLQSKIHFDWIAIRLDSEESFAWTLPGGRVDFEDSADSP